MHPYSEVAYTHKGEKNDFTAVGFSLSFSSSSGRSPGIDGRFCYFLVERDFRTGQALRRWPHHVAMVQTAVKGSAVAPVDAAPVAWSGELLALW